ncbi:MAG: hypothetical protein GEU81_08220 [Nitriliruptorales bacterium]|nr:hypothetical protein [Nitriliruptorales bacterium]
MMRRRPVPAGTPVRPPTENVVADAQEVRAHGLLREQGFDIPALVSTLSAGITLEAGDLIATGTPVGVGIGFDPPRFLQPGDVVSASATGLGTLSNPIIAPAASSR